MLSWLRRSEILRFLMSLSFSLILPSSGSQNLDSRLMIVFFPAPVDALALYGHCSD